VSTVLQLLVLVLGGAVLLTLLARRDGRLWQVATPLAFGAIVVAAWQVACTGFGIPRILLPPPSDIAAAIGTHLPLLAADFMQTVAHAVLIGWLLGSASGLLAAIALDRSALLRRGVMPLGSLVSAMPIVGVAPIMVMWFGFDWQSKAAVIVVMTFFPMLVKRDGGPCRVGGDGARPDAIVWRGLLANAVQAAAAECSAVRVQRT